MGILLPLFEMSIYAATRSNEINISLFSEWNE